MSGTTGGDEGAGGEDDSAGGFARVSGLQCAGNGGMWWTGSSRGGDGRVWVEREGGTGEQSSRLLLARHARPTTPTDPFRSQCVAHSSPSLSRSAKPPRLPRPCNLRLPPHPRAPRRAYRSIRRPTRSRRLRRVRRRRLDRASRVRPSRVMFRSLTFFVYLALALARWLAAQHHHNDQLGRRRLLHRHLRLHRRGDHRPSDGQRHEPCGSGGKRWRGRCDGFATQSDEFAGKSNAHSSSSESFAR